MNEEKPYNLEPNVEAALGYIPGVAIAILMMEKENKIVRFHAFQSIFFWIAAFAAYSMAVVLRIAIIGIFLIPIVNLGVLFMWIFLMWKAYQGQDHELPVIGRLAREESQK